MIQVILSNSKHPEYGQATIPLPLAQDQYEDCVELLEKLEIGSATKQDCKVLEISSAFPVLKSLCRNKGTDRMDSPALPFCRNLVPQHLCSA